MTLFQHQLVFHCNQKVVPVKEIPCQVFLYHSELYIPSVNLRLQISEQIPHGYLHILHSFSIELLIYIYQLREQCFDHFTIPTSTHFPLQSKED